MQGAKEWLADRMTGDRHYVETLDQAALAAVFDLAATRRADSFDKCWRETNRLITEIAVHPAVPPTPSYPSGEQ